MIRLLAVLVLAGASVNAQTITTETFGSGVDQFSIDFVTIGNAGNQPHNSTFVFGGSYSAGGVGYIFNLGKFEISREMVLKASTGGGLGITLNDMTQYTGNGGKKPATGISWFEAARFVNWLNTSKGHQQAYKFDSNENFQLWNANEAGYQASNPYRNSLARFFLPSRDEWYKGAYYDPNKNGTGLGGYWTFATGTDSAPSIIGGVTGGTSPGTAVYAQRGVVGITGPADFDIAGGLSTYGTMAQAGNVYEWVETALDSSNNLPNEFREWRGGSWGNDSDALMSGFRDANNPLGEFDIGFRVAMIPEPSSLSLLLAGGAVLMASRRKRGA